MTQAEFEKWLAILQAQDKELAKIFAEREAIRAKCEAEGGNRLYDKMWEALFGDGKNHYNF